MVALVHSGAVLGIDGYPVEVEVNLSQGLPGMSIVGLPDAAVKESSDRVTAAIRNTQLALPVRKITVNLPLLISAKKVPPSTCRSLLAYYLPVE